MKKPRRDDDNDDNDDSSFLGDESTRYAEKAYWTRVVPANDYFLDCLACLGNAAAGIPSTRVLDFRVEDA